jgi:hypothetical protein
MVIKVKIDRQEDFRNENGLWHPWKLKERLGEMPQRRDVSAGTGMPKAKGLLRGPSATQYVGKHQPRKGRRCGIGTRQIQRRYHCCSMIV